MVKKIIIVAFAVLLVMLFYSCGALWGSHDLGNKLTLLEGDKTDDRLIVYCTQYSGGACIAGTPVIPSRGDSITRYVKDAKSNKLWAIVRSIRKLNKEDDYWIISKDFNVDSVDCDKNNCDSIIQSYVKGPFKIDEFNKLKSKLGIDMTF